MYPGGSTDKAFCMVSEVPNKLSVTIIYPRTKVNTKETALTRIMGQNMAPTLAALVTSSKSKSMIRSNLRELARCVHIQLLTETSSLIK